MFLDFSRKACIVVRRTSLFDWSIINFSAMMNVDYVNNTHVISQNPKMTAINSCIEVDLTGQIVSDSIGTRMYSGKSSQN